MPDAGPNSPDVTQRSDGVVSLPDSSLPDGDVVAAIRGGDAEAFRILIRRYRDRYTRFAVRMLGNPDDAEDALQTAFVRAFRKLEQCQDPDRFGSWLYQIVINECRTLGIRRTRRERRMVRDLTVLGAMVSETGTEFVDDGRFRAEIQQALDQLDAAQREVFILKYIEELSYEDIAELTGIGISALKMRVKRASDRLRTILTPVMEHDRHG